jgi:hypothetical protein
MAIIRCFEEWRAELQSAENPINVLSDHKNLEYFMSNKLLNRRQARWAQFLSQFNFKITYRPGKAGGKPDALAHRSRDLPEEGDEREDFNFSTLIKPHQVETMHLLADRSAVTGTSAAAIPATSIPTAENQSLLSRLFDEAYVADPFPNTVLQMLDNGDRHCREITLSECGRDDRNRLTYYSHIYVPDYELLRLYLMQQYHEVPVAGYLVHSKMLELLKHTYYWLKMQKDVDHFVCNCHICQCSYTTQHVPYSILCLLLISNRP